MQLHMQCDYMTKTTNEITIANHNYTYLDSEENMSLVVTRFAIASGNGASM